MEILGSPAFKARVSRGQRGAWPVLSKPNDDSSDEGEDLISLLTSQVNLMATTTEAMRKLSARAVSAELMLTALLTYLAHRSSPWSSISTLIEIKGEPEVMLSYLTELTHSELAEKVMDSDLEVMSEARERIDVMLDTLKATIHMDEDEG